MKLVRSPSKMLVPIFSGALLLPSMASAQPDRPTFASRGWIWSEARPSASPYRPMALRFILLTCRRAETWLRSL